MADEKKKKNILDQAIDALTNRDEKQAEAEAQQQAQAANVQAEAARAEAARLRAEAEKAQAEAAQLRQAEETRQQAARAEAEAKQRRERQQAMDAAEAAQAARAVEAARTSAIKKHVWTREDTYASLAYENYGNMTEPYWRLIYEHNRELIGDHPNNIKVGMEIEIPPLPAELRKK